MKLKLNKVLTFCALITALLVGFKPQQAVAQPGEEVTYQTFYDELAPYGQWLDDVNYGYVWLPNVGPEFRPYSTDGHWVQTEYGNTWYSDYDWGWAAFHYGRWRFDDRYGWEWIPGTEWGPAWVDWRAGGDYYGWAPLGPNISLDISLGGSYYAPENYYTFVPRQYICAPDIDNYYLPVSRNNFILRSTLVVNNTFYNHNQRYVSGPRADDIRRYTNRPVNIYDINNSGRPGSTSISNNTLNIYRPNVRAGGIGNTGGAQPNQNFNGGGTINGRNRNANQQRQNGSFNDRNGSVNQDNNSAGNTRQYGGNTSPGQTGQLNTVTPNDNQNNRRGGSTVQNNSGTGGRQPVTPAQGSNDVNNGQINADPGRTQTNGQNNNWRQSGSFDHNRTDQQRQVQQQQQQDQQLMQQRQNQQQQMQRQNQQQQQNQQRQMQQQNQQQQMQQQNQQQQNQQRQMQQQNQQQQNQQRQQQNQQRQQQNQQRQMQQRPAREERPQRSN